MSSFPNAKSHKLRHATEEGILKKIKSPTTPRAAKKQNGPIMIIQCRIPDSVSQMKSSVKVRGEINVHANERNNKKCQIIIIRGRKGRTQLFCDL